MLACEAGRPFSAIEISPRQDVNNVSFRWIHQITLAAAIICAVWSLSAPAALAGSEDSNTGSTVSVIQDNATTDESGEGIAPEEDRLIMSANEVDSRAVAIAVGAGLLVGLFIYVFWLLVKPRGNERVYDSTPNE